MLQNYGISGSPVKIHSKGNGRNTGRTCAGYDGAYLTESSPLRPDTLKTVQKLQWLALVIVAVFVVALYTPGLEYWIQQILNWFGTSI